MTSSLWLNDLVSYSCQIALLVGAGAFLARALELRVPTATLAYWRVLLLACLLLPVFQPWKVSLQSSMAVLTNSEEQTVLPAAISSAPAAATSPVSWPLWQMSMWALVAGTVARGAWLLLGLAQLHRFRRKSLLLAPDSPILGDVQERLGIWADFYSSDRAEGPITFGWLRPVVILPSAVLQMDPQIQEAIVYHELLHVRRRDWICEIVRLTGSAGRKRGMKKTAVTPTKITRIYWMSRGMR